MRAEISFCRGTGESVFLAADALRWLSPLFFGRFATIKNVMRKPIEDVVICISAKVTKMSIDFYFQSLRDPNIIYHARRDVLTRSLEKLTFRPDDPPILIVRMNQKKQIHGVYYGYKNYDAFQEQRKDLLYHKPLATYSGQILTWIVAPVFLAAMMILLFNYLGYHWW